MSTDYTPLRFLRGLGLSVFIAVFLAACGGGGGGGGPAIIAPLPPPSGGGGDDDENIQMPDDPLPLNSDNAEAVATLALAYPESMQQLFAAVLEALSGLIEADGGTVVTFCDGNATVELDDRDSSRSLTDRDELIITYTNCDSAALNETVSGNIRVEFTQAQLFSGGSANLAGSLGNDIQFQLDGSTISVTGGFDFTFNKTGNQETLAATPGPGTRGFISVTIDNLLESVEQFSLTRTFVEDTQRLTLTFEGRIRSEALIGTTECTINDVITEASAEPSQGLVTCTGANSTLRLAAGGDLSVSADGSAFNSVLSQPSWQQFIEGDLLTGVIHPDLPVGSTLTPGLEIANRIEIDIVDAVYSPVRDRIYIATADSIRVLGPLDSIDDAEVIPLTEIPGVIALNRTQDTLYVGSDESPSLQAVDLDDSTVGPMVSFGPDPDDTRRYAAGLLVLDDAAERILVGTQGDTALVLENGAQLPDEDFRGGTSFAQTDDGLIWGTNRFSDLNQLIVTATGVATANELDFENFGPITSVGNLLVTDSGQVLDPRLGLKVAETDITLLEGGVGHYDAYSDRIYRITAGGRQLSVWETANFTPTGTYTLPEDGRFDRMISGNGVLMLFHESLMLVVDLITLEEFALRNCTTLSLAELTQDSTGFQVDCAFNHGVYDPVRDRIFASVPAEIGQQGNSVAQINPNTGEIETFWPVGSNPDRLVLSEDGDRLLITYVTSNQIASLDLNTGDVSRIGPALSRTAADVAEDPFVANRYLVSLQDSGVVAIIDGELAERSAGFSGPVLQFDPTQAGRAFSLSGNRLTIYSIDEQGVTQVDTDSNTLFGNDWERSGNLLFTSGGDRYNPATGIVDLNIDVQAAFLSIDPIREWLLFTAGSSVRIFDANSGDEIGMVTYPFVNQPFDEQEILAELPDDLVGVFRDSLIIAPKAELYPE